MVVRAGIGWAYVAASDVGQPMDRHARPVVRIVGVGQLIQAVLATGARRRRRLVASIGLDAVHVTAMLVLAARDRRRRRAALGDTGLSLLLTGIDYRSITIRPPRSDIPFRRPLSGPAVLGPRRVG